MICTVVAAKIFNKEPQKEYCIEITNKQKKQTLSFGKAYKHGVHLF